jgi:hypothetical protein
MRIYTKDPTKHWSNLGYTKKAKCERCASKSNLVVHHRDRNRQNNTLDNLETLCRLCHIQEHREDVAKSQRKPEVNARRGAAIRRAAETRGPKAFPKISETVKALWNDTEHRAKMVRAHNSEVSKARHSTAMKTLMNDPAHIAKRKAMKEARRHENS